VVSLGSRGAEGPLIDHPRILLGLVLGAGFAIASALGFVLVHPLAGGPVGYDTAASVLYFERIVHGQVLEQPFGATPKPAMTLVDGLLHALGGWQAVSLAAVAAYAAVVTLGAQLVRRVAGPAAGVFAYVALLGSQPLLLDESLAYAVSWACLWLLVAAYAILSDRPRYLVVGLALCMAALTRLESITVAAGATAAVAASWWVRPRLGPRLSGWTALRPAPRGAWLVAVGLLAIPVMLVHDWVLIRNPMYWAGIAAKYSPADPTAIRSSAALLAWLAHHYLGMALLVLLACLGVAWLVRRGRLGLTVGLVLLGPGIGAFLVLLAARGTYVSGRYLYLMDLAVAIAAGIGFTTVRVPEVADWLASRMRTGNVLALVAAAAVGMSAAAPFGPLDPATRASITTQRTVAENLRAAEPAIRRALGSVGTTVAAPAVLAPGLWTPRLMVDLGLRIEQVLPPRFDAAGDAYASTLHAGELVYHDRAGDPANGVATVLEAGGAVVVGGLALRLEAADPGAGWWLYRVVAGS
jgi:hypothetical protein